MKRILIPCLIAMVVVASLFGSIEGTLLFVKADAQNLGGQTFMRWIVGDDMHGSSVANLIATDSGYFVSTNHETAPLVFERTLTKYDVDHNYIWSIENNIMRNFTVAQNGSVAVIGNSGTWSSETGALTVYSDAGELLWSVAFDEITKFSGVTFNFSATSVATVDEYIFVTGFYTGTSPYTITLMDGTEIELPTRTNINSHILKFNLAGGLVDIKYVDSPNQIRINHIESLENGNIVINGFMNGPSSLLGLGNITGWDAFVVVLDTDLEVIWVRMVHDAGNMDTMFGFSVLENDIYIFGAPRTAGSNANSLLMFAPAQRPAWENETLWNVGETIIIGFDGNSSDGYATFFRNHATAGTRGLNGLTKDAKGNFILTYQTWTGWPYGYSHVVKRNSDFDIVWEREFGVSGDQIIVQGATMLGHDIMIFGHSNKRFDTDENSTNTFDGFIYIISDFELEIITTPTVQGAFIYGDSMPTLQGGVANANGTFAWVGAPKLQIGTHNYYWMFTPANNFLEPIQGHITITVAAASEYNGNDSDFPTGLVIGICAGLFLLATATTLIIVLKKRKKKDDTKNESPNTEPNDTL